MAHNTDLLMDQEITIASAVPKEMPVLMVSNLYETFSYSSLSGFS
jgi:hypothetical protein